jgi:hypothetical protein
MSTVRLGTNIHCAGEAGINLEASHSVGRVRVLAPGRKDSSKCVCDGEGQSVSALPSTGYFEKECPFSKHVKVLGRTKIWSWVLTGLEIEIYCDGEGQQQFTRPTERSNR